MSSKHQPKKIEPPTNVGEKVLRRSSANVLVFDNYIAVIKNSVGSN